MEEAVVVSMAANLFLQPAVVRVLVQYWLWHFAPLSAVSTPTPLALLANEGGDNATSTSDSTALDWPAMFFRRLALTPTDLYLRGQIATFPRPDVAASRGLYMLQFSGASADMGLAFPDEFLTMQCDFREFAAAEAAMMSNPEAYWTHVSHGGMRGNIVAQNLKQAALFGQSYHAAYFIMVALEETLLYFRERLSPLTRHLHELTLLKQLTQLLPVKVLKDRDRTYMRKVTELLTDTSQVRGLDDALYHVGQMVAEMNATALNLYAAAKEACEPLMPFGGRAMPNDMYQACLPRNNYS